MKFHMSISDIARELGVSPSTVSRALKDHPDISLNTRMRVQAFARQVNYRPNALALGLKHSRSNTLGIIIPEIVHHFFSSMISGIEDLAYSRGYRIMICQSNENYLREVVNMQALMDHRVDGLLISLSKKTTIFDHFVPAIENNIPLVFMDRICHEIDTDRVITDDFEGAYMATSHLIARGRRNIIHLAAPQQLVLGIQRTNGYYQALRDHHIQIRDELVIHCDTPDMVYALKDNILDLAGRADGIFAVNDFTAIAVMHVLQENGFEVPGHIALVGFGDDPIARIVRPALTTVEQKGYDMGKEAVGMLLERLEHPEMKTATRTKVFAATLKQRQSS
jgi:DNA-binding LacI/PurR family transcriptional regulator